jgi:multimeric flavodoxin WrbA
LPTSFSGKSVVGGAFASSATQHGGQETTLFTITTNLLHFGLTVVGPNYGFAGQMNLETAVAIWSEMENRAFC